MYISPNSTTQTSTSNVNGSIHHTLPHTRSAGTKKVPSGLCLTFVQCGSNLTSWTISALRFHGKIDARGRLRGRSERAGEREEGRARGRESEKKGEREEGRARGRESERKGEREGREREN
eukprot:1062630-Amorphochlora_amoeboformis.AAC.1